MNTTMVRSALDTAGGIVISNGIIGWKEEKARGGLLSHHRRVAAAAIFLIGAGHGDTCPALSIHLRAWGRHRGVEQRISVPGGIAWTCLTIVAKVNFSCVRKRR